MDKELKDLLLKDLCTRLPYGVRFMIDKIYLTENMIKDGYDKIQELYGITCEGNVELLNTDYHMPVESIKPYLFPLSSMTEEQKQEYQHITERWMYDSSYSISDSTDWLDVNHFDYRGLIEKGLAIDATGLNIY
jgi:hypothetical protein